MGYAKMGQKGTGIHLRQFSRAFIIDDGKQRLAFISVDCAMIGNGLRKEVSKVLNRENAKCIQYFDCETSREEIICGPWCRLNDNIAMVVTRVCLDIIHRPDLSK
jgi:hypothetical protein